MNEDRFTLLVSRMLDDDLSDEERREVQERIAGDPAAKREADELRLTVSLIRELDECEAPASILAGIREVIHRPPWYKRAADWLVGGPLLTPARGLAFVLVAAIVGGTAVFLNTFHQTEPRLPLAVAELETPAAPAIVHKVDKAEEEVTLAAAQPSEVNTGDTATAAPPAREVSAAPVDRNEGRAESRASILRDEAEDEAAPVPAAPVAERAEAPASAEPPVVVASVEEDEPTEAEPMEFAEVSGTGAVAGGRGLAVAPPADERAGAVELAARSRAAESDRLTPSTVPPPKVDGVVEPPSPELPLTAEWAMYGPQPTLNLHVTGPTGGLDRVETVSDVESAEIRSLRYVAEPELEEELHFLAPSAVQPRELALERKAGSGPVFTRCERTRRAADTTGSDARKTPLCKRIIRGPAPMTGEKEDLDSAPNKTRTMKFDRDNTVREFKGAYSGLKDRGDYVIEDEDAWKRLWTDMTSNMVPAPDVPAIDFATDFAIGVSMGEQMSGGYATIIEAFELEGKTIRVIVRETRPGDPGSTGGFTMALTQPYHILILPRQIAGDYVSTAKGYEITFEYR